MLLVTRTGDERWLLSDNLMCAIPKTAAQSDVEAIERDDLKNAKYYQSFSQCFNT